MIRVLALYDNGQYSSSYTSVVGTQEPILDSVVEVWMRIFLSTLLALETVAKAILLVIFTLAEGGSVLSLPLLLKNA